VPRDRHLANYYLPVLIVGRSHAAPDRVRS